jgi:hypothetical protein
LRCYAAALHEDFKESYIGLICTKVGLYTLNPVDS